MKHPGAFSIRVQPILNFVHVIEPSVYDLSLAKLSKSVGHETRPLPVALFQMAAANHENQRLTSADRDISKVVAEIGTILDSSWCTFAWCEDGLPWGHGSW